MYSADNDRNLGSLDMLSSQLFPEKHAKGSLVAHTKKAEQDPWEIGDYIDKSPCAHASSSSSPLQDFEHDPAFRVFVDEWNQASNSTWSHVYLDCITTSRCSGAPLPPAIGERLADQALLWGFLQHTATVRLTDWTSILVSPVLEEIADRVRNGAK